MMPFFSSEYFLCPCVVGKATPKRQKIWQSKFKGHCNRIYSVIIGNRFGILGGGRKPALGTFSEYVVVQGDQVMLAPNHLDDVHMAAWPLAGLTA
jgi:NADPH:quinone reductase-like Zn-dependent oxidoreductase